MTIRTKILLSLALAISLSVGGTSCIVFYQSSKAAIADFQVNAEAQMQRMDQYLQLIFDNTKSILLIASERNLLKESQNKATSYLDTQQNFTTDKSKLPAYERLLYNQLSELHSMFSSVKLTYIGYENGAFTQSPDDVLTAAYDPRTRIWYKAAKAKPNEVILSEVFMSVNGSPTFTLAKAVHDNKQELVGVVGVDFQIEDLDAALGDIAIGKTGHSIIIEQTGTIIIDQDNAERVFKKVNEVNMPALEELFLLDTGMKSVVVDGLPHYAAVYTTKNNWKIVMFIEESELASHATATAANTFLFGALLGLFIMLMGIFIARSIAQPIALLANTSKKVATGDIQALNLLPSFKGELFDLQDSMKSMVEQLSTSLNNAHAKTESANQALDLAKHANEEAKQAQSQAEKAKREGTLFAAKQLEGIGEHLLHATENLFTQINHSAEGATRQDEKVEETSQAMHKLNTTINNINSDTQIASSMSAKTRQKAEESKNVILQVIAEIQRIHKESQELKSDMDLLATQAQAINQVMNVIVDIADQTNLLALNAAIEAARAGEAGKGFAVVADEVRKLAEKTTHSTTEVGASIRTIQQSTQRSMQQVDNTNHNIERATELVQKSGIDLEEIVNFADSTADKIHSISVTSNEQAKASSDINESLHQVSTIASKTKENMQESTNLLFELNEQSTELTLLIKKLKEE